MNDAIYNAALLEHERGESARSPTITRVTQTNSVPTILIQHNLPLAGIHIRTDIHGSTIAQNEALLLLSQAPLHRHLREHILQVEHRVENTQVGVELLLRAQLRPRYSRREYQRSSLRYAIHMPSQIRHLLRYQSQRSRLACTLSTPPSPLVSTHFSSSSSLTAPLLLSPPSYRSSSQDDLVHRVCRCSLKVR